MLIRRAFDARSDVIDQCGAEFLHFDFGAPLTGRFGSVDDVGAIVRAHERDPRDAAILVQDQVRTREASNYD